MAGTIGMTMAARPAGTTAPKLTSGPVTIGFRLLCSVKSPTATASGTDSSVASQLNPALARWRTWFVTSPSEVATTPDDDCKAVSTDVIT